LFNTLFHKAAHALFLIGLSVFLALALNAPVSKIASLVPGKKKGSRALGTALSYLLVVVFLGVFMSLVVPPLVKQTDRLIAQAPHLIDEFRNQDGSIGNFIRKYHLGSQITAISNQLGSRAHNIGGNAFTTLSAVGSSVFALLTVLVMTFMLLVEGPRWVNFLRGIVPGRRKDMAKELTDDMYKVIKGYINGQVALAFIATLLITPALFILHISYPMALILMVFICGLIPMIGHSIGAVIITTVALFTSVPAAIIILTYYFLYLQFENYVIQPKIQSNTTNMSPFLVFSSLIVGVSFGGLLGGLVSIPVAGCLRIIFLEYLRSKNYLNAKEFQESITPKDNTSY
ncbi:AI-2E family transporter, partial [bacterium]|nr:AI-2E family transporter [bacterium]